MTGRRARRLLSEEMEQRFYRLQQFLGCYLHEDWPIFYGTPEKAVDAAIAEYPIDVKRQVRQELTAVLAETQDDKKLCAVLNFGLGVNLSFKPPAEARKFAEEVDRKLLASIKGHFEQPAHAEKKA